MTSKSIHLLWLSLILVTNTISIVATYYLISGKAIPARANNPNEPTVSETAHPKVELPKSLVGPTIKLAPFVVTLRENRFLKVEMGLELETPEIAVEIQGLNFVMKMKEEFTDAASKFDPDDLIPSEGKIKLRNELFERFNRILQTGKIKRIYFNEFIIQ